MCSLMPYREQPQVAFSGKPNRFPYQLSWTPRLDMITASLVLVNLHGFGDLHRLGEMITNCYGWETFFLPPPIPTHRSYIHVCLTDGTAWIFLWFLVFTSHLTSPTRWSTRQQALCEREWGEKERGRRRKSQQKRTTMLWLGFEPSDPGSEPSALTARPRHPTPMKKHDSAMMVK